MSDFFEDLLADLAKPDKPEQADSTTKQPENRTIPVTELQHKNTFNPSTVARDKDVKKAAREDKENPIPLIQSERKPSKLMQMTCESCGKTEIKPPKYLTKEFDMANPRNSKYVYFCNRCSGKG